MRLSITQRQDFCFLRRMPRPPRDPTVFARDADLVVVDFAFDIGADLLGIVPLRVPTGLAFLCQSCALQRGMGAGKLTANF
jgi:hypothetical protein